MNIRLTILDYIKKRFPSSVENEQSDIDLTLILDSFAIYEFILFLEQQFSIKINDEEITSDRFSTLNKIVIFIEDKINN